MSIDEKFLTQKQIQTRYGDCTRQTLYRWRLEGRIPQPVTIGGHPLWRLSEILEFENRLERV